MVYNMAWRASYDIMVWSGGPGMGYSMAVRALHGKVWPGEHRIVFGLVWRASHGIWLWPGRQGMGLGIVYDMAWLTWHGIWYYLSGKEWLTK